MNISIENTLKTITEISKPERGYDSDMRYPQYKYRFEGVVISTDTWIQLQEEAKKQLDEPNFACEDVKQHWRKIIAGFVPFDMRVVRPLCEE